VSKNSTLLRLNVGFIVNQSIGYSRKFPFEIPRYAFPNDLQVQNLSGVAIISRTTEGLLVQVKGQAWTDMECVLCLDGFTQQLQFDFVEMYTFPSHADEDTELILPDDLHIDLLPLLREYLNLDIPINPICSPDCKGLCPICGEKLADSNCSHEEEDVDPRFDVLKSLLDDEAPSSG
jgi:uncharacterized protein